MIQATPQTGGYEVVCHISEDRRAVYKSLGLFSDYLNWNTEPEIEQRLREVLCDIYGHQPYSGHTWKPANMCYWCHAHVEPK